MTKYKEFRRITFESTGNWFDLEPEEYKELMKFAENMQPVEEQVAELKQERDELLENCEHFAAHVHKTMESNLKWINMYNALYEEYNILKKRLKDGV